MLGAGDLDEFSNEGDLPLDDLGRGALVAGKVRDLTLEHVGSRGATAGEEHRKGHLVGLVGDDRADPATLAVSDHPESTGGDLRLIGEELDGGECVLGVVECGRVGQLDGFAPGVAGTAVIETKNDDPASGEAIGEITERLVGADCFVSILRARTRDQDDARERAGSSRDRERSSEFEPVNRLREPHLSFVIDRFWVGVRGHGVGPQRRRLGGGARSLRW